MKICGYAVWQFLYVIFLIGEVKECVHDMCAEGGHLVRILIFSFDYLDDF